MSVRYRSNLASKPFGRYRATNVSLALILILFLGFAVWQIVAVAEYNDTLEELREGEQRVRAEWEVFGNRINELEVLLGHPDAVEEIAKIRFLNEIIERKEFSWTLLLREVERTIPETAYIVSMSPNINDSGDVRLEMEARVETVDALAEFLTNFGDNPAFANINVFVEEVGEVEDSLERRFLVEVDYEPSGLGRDQ